VTGVGRDGVAVASPFKGLTHFTEDDVALFFGRSRERDVIVANVKARRLTLLYGESGVGKSSLLRAGVMRALHDAARRDFDDEDVGRPEYVPAIVASWSGDPLSTLVDTLSAAVAPFVRERVLAALPERLDAVIDVLAAQADTRLIVILDQLEEYFLYHGDEKGEGTLAEELPRMLTRPNVRANFLLSIREDALAKLDRFKRDVPALFDTVLRVGPLDRDAGRQAIVGPLGAFEGSGPKDAEPALVDAVLDQVAVGQLVLEGSGQGRVEHDGAARTTPAIEAPYLQLVLARLWEEESDPRMLRLATLERLGGAEAIVRRHLDDALDSLDERERPAAADLLRYLVTPSGTKIALDAADLASFTGRSDVAPVLEKLTGASARILRAVGAPPGRANGTRYEIAHDVLGGAILDWRARYLQAQERERQIAANRERVRRLRTLVAMLAAVIAVVAGVAVAMVLLWQNAREQKRRADAQAASALAANARSELHTDPAAALATARRAVLKNETTDTVDALRAALFASHERRRLRVDASSAALTPDDRFALIVPSDGPPQLRDLASSEVRRTFGAGRAKAAALSADGRWVVTVGTDGTARVWPANGGGPRDFHGAAGVETAFFSPDGGFVVTAGSGTARVWRTATGKPFGRRIRHRYLLDAAISRGGRRLVTGSLDGTVNVWSPSSGKLRYRLRVTDGDAARTVAVAPDGRFAAAATAHGALVWSLPLGRGTPDTTTCGKNGETNAVSFSGNGRLLVMARADGTAEICEVVSGTAYLDLLGHGKSVTSVAFDANGASVITVGDDGTVRTWAVGLVSLPGRTNGAAFDPTGRRVATAALVGDKVRVWDARSGRAVPRGRFGSSDAIATALRRVKTTAVSPDGTVLASAAGEGLVQLRDPKTKRSLVTLDGGGTVSVAFDPAGAKLLVGRIIGAVVYDCPGCGSPSVLEQRAQRVAVR
jgi:WD40 repeat protein